MAVMLLLVFSLDGPGSSLLIGLGGVNGKWKFLIVCPLVLCYCLSLWCRYLRSEGKVFICIAAVAGV